MADCVVVTGAARGIGRAIVKGLANDGQRVIALDLDGAALEDLALEVSGVRTVLGDVRDISALRAAEQAALELGRLIAWVNNAGIVRLSPLHEVTPEELDTVLDTNLRAVLLGCQVALQSFLAHGIAGSIVNISSVHGQVSFPGYAVYDAAKGGVEALTRYVCVEYGHLGIRCNAVAPGVVDTSIVPSNGPSDPGAIDAAKALSPMRRISSPDEIADAVRFLISTAARAINGQIMGVDNGMAASAINPTPESSIRFATRLSKARATTAPTQR